MPGESLVAPLPRGRGRSPPGGGPTERARAWKGAHPSEGQAAAGASAWAASPSTSFQVLVFEKGRHSSMNTVCPT
ncbi:hypothetical protein MPOCJGCO_2229 [Methylobacterium trifolii]|uniref:Uncharacterized protein n=1 Tax=Methylobacterium trifolii TaxID=1003092 RepID=A0ABQ4TXY0_9HYPH|nr:hypothetical protein MPOCJGCO_2229 [Methylobacterium trifolii]